MTRINVIAGLAGVLFGLGLAVSGMADPAKVIGFLDLAGQWDPTLAMVMGGALLVTMPLFSVILRRKAPMVGQCFHLSTHTEIDKKLLGGAALFGIGWGLSGFCPGPAIVSLASFSPTAVAVVAALAAGMLLHDITLGRKR